MKYVVIEGIIGAGKTTLATQVSKLLKSKPILEEFADNPFLSAFYADPAGKAFHLEMSFLVARRNQMLNEIKKGKALLISDYHFYKTLLFARETLPSAELKIFKEVFENFSRDIPEPDLTVFIDTYPETALRNIGVRGRDYETGISIDYLKRIHKSYHKLLKSIPASRKLVLPAVHAEAPELPFTAPHIASVIASL